MKKLLMWVCFGFVGVGYTHAQETFVQEQELSVMDAPIDSIDIFCTITDSLADHTQQFLGVRYVYGGTTKRGFDCSGFTKRMFSDFGVDLPHSSAAQARQGIKVTQEEVQKGDLIFFKSRNRSSKRVGHVGIVISEPGNPIKFIHASVNRGICITQLDQSSYYKPRFITIRRVL